MARRTHKPALIVGVVENTLDAGPQRGPEQSLVRSVGVRWIREELRWPDLEPQRGVFRWRSFDSLLTSAARHGLHVLPLLLGTPRWAGPAPLALPRNPATFASFAAAAAARYGPGGTFWRKHPKLDPRLAPQWFELWNEPYTLPYSQDGIKPARYARMVVAATAAGRAANPRTRWLMAVDLVYGNAQARHNWIAALYRAEPDLNRSFDGVAVHPYSYYAPTAGANATSLAFRFNRVGTIAHELAAHGAGNRPIWITEVGWSTCQLRPDCVSDQSQARDLAATFALVRSRYARVVRALFVYRLSDLASGLPADREAHYGVMRTNGSRKPAFSVISAQARFGGRRPVRPSN